MEPYNIEDFGNPAASRSLVCTNMASLRAAMRLGVMFAETDV